MKFPETPKKIVQYPVLSLWILFILYASLVFIDTHIIFHVIWSIYIMILFCEVHENILIRRGYNQCFYEIGEYIYYMESMETEDPENETEGQ